MQIYFNWEWTGKLRLNAKKDKKKKQQKHLENGSMKSLKMLDTAW